MKITNILIITVACGLIRLTTLHAQSSTDTQPAAPAAPTINALARGLIGTWYCTGNADQPCWIASADDLLFAITTDKRASRILCNAEGLVLAQDYEPGLRGVVTRDAILWSNGTWWARHPFTAQFTAKATDTPTKRAESPTALQPPSIASAE